MITITVISGHEHDRQAIAAILAEHDDFHIAGIGVDGYDALKSARTQQPDIIIMDFSMKDSNCTDLAPIIKRNSPSTALIVLYSHDERIVVSKALMAGVSGCLLKQGGINHLPSSVRCVYNGGLYLSQPIRNQVLQRLREPKSTKPKLNEPRLIEPEKNTMWKYLCSAGHRIGENFFTFTEMRIFFGITLGFTDGEIAKDLNISTGSLRNCITRIKEKTRLRNRTQMTIFALSAAMMCRKRTAGSLRELRDK